MADKSGATYRDLRTMGPNEVRQQFRHYVHEAGNVIAADTVEFELELAEDEGGVPMVSLTAWSVDGGMSTPAVATHVTSNGDTVVFEFHYPQNQKSTAQFDETTTYTEVVHALAGVTGGAATPAQIVVSLNADVNFRLWGFAAVTATNVVTVFPKGPESHVRIGNDSTSALAGSFGTAIFNDKRTFSQLNPSEYLMTYTPGVEPKKVVITKTGATVPKLVLVVSAH